MGFIAAGVYKAEGIIEPWDIQFFDGSFSIEGRIDGDPIFFSAKPEEGYVYIKYSEEEGLTIEQEKDWPFEEISDFIKSKSTEDGESGSTEDGESEIEYTLDFIVFPLYHFYKKEKQYQNVSAIKGSKLKYTKLVPDSDLTTIQSLFSVKREEEEGGEGGEEYDLILAPKFVSSFGFNAPKE